jgi:hypothetical protein
MTCLFDRFLTQDLSLPAPEAVVTFTPHPRIQVLIYDDSPCWTAIFLLDGKPILKENLIDNISEYYHRTSTDRNFHAFLIEMSPV